MLLVENLEVLYDLWILGNSCVLAVWTIIPTAQIIMNSSRNTEISEAAIGGVLWKYVFWETFQISQENTCARVFFI